MHDSGLGTYWMAGGLSKCFFNRLINTITPNRIPFRVLITLLNIYLLSPKP